MDKNLIPFASTEILEIDLKATEELFATLNTEFNIMVPRTGKATPMELVALRVRLEELESYINDVKEELYARNGNGHAGKG